MSSKTAKFLLVLTGSLSWSLTMVKSGLIYPFGMGFWGPNGHDGVWHIALINSLAKFNLGNPVFAGERLQNYHWFYDGFLALIHRLTAIPAETLYFQIFPPIIAFLVGWLTYEFVLKWRKSELQAWLATFFIYFGGSWGWLVSFLRDGSFGGESMFWANQAVSTLINPPFAASLVLLLLGLRAKSRMAQALIFGTLIQVKAYAGVVALAGLAAASLWDRRNLRVFLGSLLVALLIFIPTNRNAGNLLVFSPLWFPETMVSFADRFYWPRLANAIQAYKATGNWLKLFPAEVLAFSIFWFGNLGTRVVAVNWKKKFESTEVLILGMLAAGTILPLLFIQRGNPWNTIQFFYYALFFSGILAGVGMGQWLEKQRRGFSYLVAAALLFLTLPTTLNTVASHYLPGRPPAKISHKELEALRLLKTLNEGVVLTYPFDSNLRKNWLPPQPLWVYETTSYVAAISQKSVFLEDEMNLEITGYDWRTRREAVEKFFAGISGPEFLQENDISYIYLVDGQKLPPGELGLEEIYNQENVRIFRVIE